MVSPDSYGSVLLLILFTYGFSVGVTAPWAASLVITVQIATVWAVLHVSRARRPVRRVAGVLLLISAIAALVNLFVGRETAGAGVAAFMSAVLYLIAPFSITRSLVFRREVDLQTVLGAIDIYLLVGMLFAFVYRFLGVVQPSAFFGAAGGREVPAGPVLLLHHAHHDRVREPRPGRQPGPDLRGGRDAHRAAVPGDRRRQGHQRLHPGPAPDIQGPADRREAAGERPAGEGP